MHGTKNLLSSVAKSKDTVKRVVLTSSVAGARSRATLAADNAGGLLVPRSTLAVWQYHWLPALRLPVVHLPAAVHGDNDKQPPKSGSVYTAEDWNVTSTPEKEPYFVSKVCQCGSACMLRTLQSTTGLLTASARGAKHLSCLCHLCRQRRSAQHMTLPRRKASR